MFVLYPQLSCWCDCTMRNNPSKKRVTCKLYYQPKHQYDIVIFETRFIKIPIVKMHSNFTTLFLALEQRWLAIEGSSPWLGSQHRIAFLLYLIFNDTPCLIFLNFCLIGENLGCRGRLGSTTKVIKIGSANWTRNQTCVRSNKD